jgi:GMP synthase (glutamine-hydrolysing)
VAERAALLGEAVARPAVLVLQHAIHEPLGTLEPVLATAAELHTLAAYADSVEYSHAVDGFANSGAYDAVIALGGPVGVYERDEVPVLGLCLGAQLLAWTLGAQVRPGRTLGLQKEIGWRRVRLTERGRVDPAFHGFNDDEPVFQWHGDTFDIPEGAWRLAGSDLYPNQAFRFGRWVYGLQFHVEVTPELAGRWTEVYAPELAALDSVDAAGIVSMAGRQAPLQKGRSLALGRHFVECIWASVAGRMGRRAPAVEALPRER